MTGYDLKIIVVVVIAAEAKTIANVWSRVVPSTSRATFEIGPGQPLSRQIAAEPRLHLTLNNFRHTRHPHQEISDVQDQAALGERHNKWNKPGASFTDANSQNFHSKFFYG